MKLRIEKAIYGGDGLARIPAGKTVFVPATLPGELVEAHIAEERRGFANGELDAILEPSPERVVPGCEYVPRCGGCQYQHANAAFQLQMKLDILKETLERAHLPMPGEIGSLAGPPWGYRNRIRLHVMKRGLGYRQRGSHNLLPVTHCPIAAPLLEQAIAAVTHLDLGSLCDEVEFFTNGEQDQLLVSLWPGRQAPSDRALEDFAERLKAELPALTGVGLFSGAKHEALGTAFVNLQCLRPLLPGKPRQLLSGQSLSASGAVAAGFAGCPGRLAWDLYSGAGLFARALDFENVTAVESAGFSADDLKHNLAGTPHRVVRSSTLDFLRSQTLPSRSPS